MMDRLLGVRAAHVLVAMIAFLLLAWTLVAVIDVYDAAGLRSTLGRDDGGPVWLHLFDEGGFTEMLQWVTLATVGVVAAIRAGELRQLGDVECSRFFALTWIHAEWLFSGCWSVSGRQRRDFGVLAGLWGGSR